MATIIKPQDVVRLAKEVFPGLEDKDFETEGPLANGSWYFGVRLLPRQRSFEVYTHADIVRAHSAPHIDELLVECLSIDELRRFLERCRDAFAKYLTALLENVLGPVRVLPEIDELDQLTVTKFMQREGGARDAEGISVSDLLDTYAGAVRERRAAKPAGS